MESLDQEIVSKLEEITKKREEVRVLKKLNKQIKAFEQLAVKDLQNNLLTDVKSMELDSASCSGPSGKVIYVAFKLNGQEIVLKVEEDRDIQRAKLMGENWKRIIAEKLLDELYKKFTS